MDDADLAAWLEDAKGGDAAALRELLRRFEGEVRTVVRHRLPRAMRSQYDSMDFVQAVWQSVFTGGGAGLGKFATPQQLLAYLAGVARNKVLEEYRKRTTQKYNIDREEPLYVQRGGCAIPRDLPAHDPSPSQDAQAGDRLEQITRGRSPLERQVVDLRRQGLTFQEIADRLGMHESAVRRIIEAIRQGMGDFR